jgi:hypothetical protein
MPKRVPKYSHHKPTGLARVRINGKSFDLGPEDSEQSRQRHDALIANDLTGTLDADRETLTIGRLAVLFMDHAAGYSVKDGQPTGEISRLQTAFRPLVQKDARERVSRFGPLKLKDVRDLMIRQGWTRTASGQSLAGPVPGHPVRVRFGGSNVDRTTDRPETSDRVCHNRRTGKTRTGRHRLRWRSESWAQSISDIWQNLATR